MARHWIGWILAIVLSGGTAAKEVTLSLEELVVGEGRQLVAEPGGRFSLLLQAGRATGTGWCPWPSGNDRR